jgi:hypothetical protein
MSVAGVKNDKYIPKNKFQIQRREADFYCNYFAGFHQLCLKWSLSKTPSNFPLRGRMPTHMPQLWLVRLVSLLFQGNASSDYRKAGDGVMMIWNLMKPAK